MSQYRESMIFTIALLLWLCLFWALRSLSLYIPIAALCVGAIGKQVADRHRFSEALRSRRIGATGTTVATVSVAAVGAFALYAVYRVLGLGH